MNIKEQIVLRADSQTRKVLYNGKICDYDVDKFIFKLLDMVSDWPKELVEEGVKDGVTYLIVIKDGEDKKIFVFKNKFPNDIYRLNDFVNEVKYDGKIL